MTTTTPRNKTEWKRQMLLQHGIRSNKADKIWAAEYGTPLRIQERKLAVMKAAETLPTNSR